MRPMSTRNSNSKPTRRSGVGVKIKLGSAIKSTKVADKMAGSECGSGSNSRSNRCVCSYCGDLVTSEDLLTHEKRHLCGSTLKCLLCPQTFRLDSLLKLHHRTRHCNMENLKSGTLSLKPEEQTEILGNEPEGQGQSVKVKRSTRSSMNVKKLKVSENLSRSDAEFGSALANKGRGHPRKIRTAPKSRGRPKKVDPVIISKAVTLMANVKREREEYDTEQNAQFQDVNLKQEPPETETPFLMVTRKSAHPALDIQQVKIKEEPEDIVNLQCKYCCYRGTTEKCLEMHYLRIHTSHDKKPFQCTAPGCGKGFATSWGHRRHVKTCRRKRAMGKKSNSEWSSDEQDEEAFLKICPHCPHRPKFPSCSEVLAHIWRTHVNSFRCHVEPNCQRRFGTIAEINSHVRNKHVQFFRGGGQVRGQRHDANGQVQSGSGGQVPMSAVTETPFLSQIKSEPADVEMETSQ